jgi:hypothetical protein
MSSENPTRLEIGQQATIDGQRMTVRGRVVLSMIADDGETYYWNEFNLVGDAGREVTLVFEETDAGPTWKWYELFEPLRPLSVDQAKLVRVGNTVDLGEGRLEVTLVDQTRVEYIEGVAPEGVERGDVAQYFNAESRDESFVVSWSRDEIEFYRGRDLARGRVEALFHLRPQLARPVEPSFSREQQSRPGRNWMTVIFAGIAVLMVGLILAGTFSKSSRKPPRETKQLRDVPASPAVVLKPGARGVLDGRELTVTAHCVQRVVRMGGGFERHEYVVTESTGETLLLVNSAGGSPRDWYLLRSVKPPAGFSPYEAAALRQGKTVQLAGRSLQIFQIFAAEVRSLEGAVQAIWRREGRSYGLLARAAEELVLMRWDGSELYWYQGRAMTEAQVRSALTSVESAERH